MNPRTGFEDIYERNLVPTSAPKKVAVIGAGPAGILCAITAAHRGHSVVLFEKSDRVGGMLVPGSVAKIKYEVKNYLTYLEHQVKVHQEKCDLAVELESEVTPESLKARDFDVVVVSVGGTAVTPRLPGVEQKSVIQAIDLFRNPDLAAKAQNVVVIGGGAVGCEAAQFLAAELGKKVTVVEMLPTIMPGVCTANRGHLIHELESLGVLLWNCTRLVSVEGNNVKLARNVSTSVPDPYVTWTPLLPENISNPFAKHVKEQIEEQTIQADLIVLAMGLRSDRDFYQSCVSAQAAREVIELGDAFQIGRVFEAVKSGFLVGNNL